MSFTRIFYQISPHGFKWDFTQISFRTKPNTQDCVRRRMLPPALGGLRVSRAAAPGPSCTREYGKDQVVMRSPARQEDYTTPRFQMASAAICDFLCKDNPLSDCRYAIWREIAVCRDDSKTISQRRCDDHAIRRVFMVLFKFSCPEHGFIRERQHRKLIFLENTVEPIPDRAL